MPLTFPASPTNDQTVTLGGQNYKYNSTKGVWEASGAAGGFDASAFDSHILPATNETYDIGSANKKIRDLYLSDSTLNIGTQSISANSDGIVLPAVTIGTGTNKVILSATASGGLKQAGTNSAGVAAPESTGGGVGESAPGAATSYADMDALIAATGMTTGQTALVTSLNRLFMYTGTGWFKIADMSNASPTDITGVEGTYGLAKDGTATVVTVASTDPEGFPLTFSHAVTTGSLGSTATVVQGTGANTNVFTITPSTDTANVGNFSLTFSVTDGTTGAVNAISAFTLSFGSWGAPALTHNFAHTNPQAGSGLATWTESIDASEDGEYLVVGALTISKAFIFKRTGNTYAQVAELPNYEGAGGFGRSVIINNAGDTAVSTTGSGYGAAYVYTRSGSTWSSQQKLVSSDLTSNQQLGKNAIGISSDGNTLMVGAQNDDPSGNSTGAVYIFVRSGSTWTQQQKIKAPSGDQPIFFGNSGGISSDGNTIVVGSYYTPNWGAGVVYVYTRSGTTWSHQQKIVSSDIQASDEFGSSSDISGDGNYIVVGARNEDTGGSNQGSAYIFKVSGSTWTQEAIIRRTLLTDINGNTISAANRILATKFGTAVSINNDGSTVAIGQPDGYGNSVAIADGTCHVYTRIGTTWTERSFINNPSGVMNYNKVGGSDNFGGSLALSKDDSTLIIGASGFTGTRGRLWYYVQG